MSRAPVLAFLSIAAFAAPIAYGQEAQPALRIAPGDWGSGSTPDILAVCRSAADEFFSTFSVREWRPVTVYRASDGVPRVAYELGDEGQLRVFLNAQDTYWAQYAFQFSHECCHIACNYRSGDKSNQWFEESLCEAASLFTLRRMAKTWETRPPYPNWKDFGASLSGYADNRIAECEKLGPQTLAEWYRKHESSLRGNPVDRERNEVVAVALLPLLERNPESWNAVRFLNQGDADRERSFEEYLREWRSAAPDDQKEFVAEIAKLFEIDVD